MAAVAGSGLNAARGSIAASTAGLSTLPRPAEKAVGPVQLASIPAYYNSRSLPNLHQKPTYREEYMHKNPAAASSVIDVDLFQHQALPFRATPHPFENHRWPRDPVMFNTPLEGGQMNRGYDDRRQPYWFGAHEQRWKRHWLPAQEEEEEIPELTLEELKLFLTNRFGTLRIAFEHLDFIKNGKISAIEWQEGLFNLLYGSYSSAAGKKGKAKRYHLSQVPRWMFNEQMKKIFMVIDKDGSGEISYEEFAKAQEGVKEFPHAASRRRKEEQMAHEAEKWGPSGGPSAPSQAGSSKGEEEDEENLEEDEDEEDEEAKDDGEGKKKEKKEERTEKEILRDEELSNFTAFMLNHFPSVEGAFKAMDLNGNGLLSGIEFADGARTVGYDGHAMQLFAWLDKDGSGTISVREFKKLVRPPKKDLTRVSQLLKQRRDTKAERLKRLRSEIAHPGPWQRGMCLLDLHAQFPMREKVSSSAHFYSFPRVPTRRMQVELHPEQNIPGHDPFNYQDARGPGTYEIGDTVGVKHPRLTEKYQVGKTLNKVKRFGPMVPSWEGRLDEELNSERYMNYPEEKVADQRTIPNQGAVWNRKARMGRNFGFDNSGAGIVEPRPGNGAPGREATAKAGTLETRPGGPIRVEYLQEGKAAAQWKGVDQMKPLRESRGASESTGGGVMRLSREERKMRNMMVRPT